MQAVLLPLCLSERVSLQLSQQRGDRTAECVLGLNITRQTQSLKYRAAFLQRTSCFYCPALCSVVHSWPGAHSFFCRWSFNMLLIVIHGIKGSFDCDPDQRPGPPTKIRSTQKRWSQSGTKLFIVWTFCPSLTGSSNRQPAHKEEIPEVNMSHGTLSVSPSVEPRLTA